jgi:tetratricopeptide (TPR) repeat protein
MKRIATWGAAICLLCCVTACQDTALRYYNKGIDAIEDGDTALAVEYFEKSVQERDSDPDAHFNLAVAYYQAGRYDDALRELRIAEEYHPSDPQLHFNIAEVYSAMGQYQAAKTEYEYAIRLSPDFVEAHDALGKLLMDGGHYAAAESHFHDALEIQPSFSETQLNMGWLYVYLGKYNEASHYFYRGLKMNPNSIYGRLGLARSLSERGDYEDALAEYRKVQVRDKQNADALLGMGVCMLELGRDSEAKHFITKSIESKKDNPAAYDALGDLYFRQHQYIEAIANYRMAVVQQEDLVEAHLGLGQALEAVGFLTESEEALQNALFHDPDNPVILYRLGQVEYLLKNKARALSYYEMALEKSKDDIELQHTIRNAIKEMSEEDTE